MYGGLGVTDDDITRAVIFDYFGSKEFLIKIIGKFYVRDFQN